MSIERARSCAAPSAQVTQRLCGTLVLLVGVACVFGGYLLGRMSPYPGRRSHDIVSLNLSTNSESLYKKAMRISPKVVHNSDPEKIKAKLLEIFHCAPHECAGSLNSYNLPDFMKNAVRIGVDKLLKTIHNATVYLDTLR